jgi:hypothetical protein
MIFITSSVVFSSPIPIIISSSLASGIPVWPFFFPPQLGGKGRTLQVGQEEVDDLVLLDGEGEEVNFFDRLDLAVLDQSAEFSDWDPGSLIRDTWGEYNSWRMDG